MSIVNSIRDWIRNGTSHTPATTAREHFVENVADTLSGLLTATKVAVPIIMVGWGLFDAFRAYTTSVVMMPLKVSKELADRGITSDIIVARILDRMENIRHQAAALAPANTGAWDNVAGIRSANDFDRQLPDLGSSASLVAEILGPLHLGKPVVTGEVLCPPETKECALDQALFHLRVMDKTHRLPVTAVKGGDNGQANDVDGRLEAVARGLLERLNPMLFAATIYGQATVSEDDRKRVMDAIGVQLANKSVTERAAIHRQLAALMLPRHPAEAISQFSLALDANPQDINALAGQAQAYVSLGRLDLAAATYDAAITIAEKTRSAGTPLHTLYLNRGVVLYNDDQTDKALQDFARSRDLNDSDAALSNAYALLDKGQQHEALVALDAARTLVGDDTRGRFALDFGTAIAQFEAGRFAEAARGFEAAFFRDVSYLYPRLWQVIAVRRNGDTWPPRHLDSVSTRGWPGPIWYRLNGRLSDEALLAQASAQGDQDNPPVTRLCEANFYLAELALAEGRGGDAIRLFSAAIRTPLPRVMEYRVAKRELGRLQQTSELTPR